MNDDEDLKKTLTFLKAADEVATERCKTYEFTCPNCGGKAIAARTETNGHIHAGCKGCHIKIME